MFKLSRNSMLKLIGVHPNLVKVVKRALELTKQDFTVLCGVRTRAEQQKLFAQGRTMAGQIVAWTLNSRHFVDAEGFGRAVDLVPYPVDWEDSNKFNEIAAAMFAAAKELDVEIRWGADWDQDGKSRERGESDSPHFELVKKG